MGLFDYLTCKYPLPVDGANALVFQFKDAEVPYMDRYEIREDGTLWHENYDTEDRSELGKWEKEHPGEEPPKEIKCRIGGMLTPINKRWEQVKMTGEIRFYGSFTGDYSDRIEFSAYFVDGRLNQLHLIEYQKAKGG